MDFIVNNYMWVIIIVIMVLMAIVGYIADKTDFGRKQFSEKVVKEKVVKEKKVKEKKKKNKEEMPVENEEVNQEVLVSDEGVFVQPINNDSVQENIEELKNVETFDLSQVETNNFANNTNDSVESIDQSLFEPLPSLDQNSTVSNDSTENASDDVWSF